jgi:FlaG/FlaF family flagellin (archaellin)
MALILALLAISTGAALATPFFNTDAPPADEQIAQYEVYVDGLSVGVVDAQADGSLKYDLAGTKPGAHTFEAEAINIWGKSPMSDPIKSPVAPSKPAGGKLDK